MRIDITQMSEEDLVDLNHQVVERLRFLAHARAHARMLEFHIGDRVAFTPDGRPEVVGILAKYNRKTVTIVTETGQRWNVAPGLLKQAPRSDGTSFGGNVIPMKGPRP